MRASGGDREARTGGGMGSRLRASAAVGLWLGLASLAQALLASVAWAGWGDENWGEMLWGPQVSAVPAVSAQGLAVLVTVLLIVTSFWRRRRASHSGGSPWLRSR